MHTGKSFGNPRHFGTARLMLLNYLAPRSHLRFLRVLSIFATSKSPGVSESLPMLTPC